MREKLNMTVKLCVMCAIFPLYYPQTLVIFLGLIDAWYLGIFCGYQSWGSWDHGTRGNGTDKKNHQDQCGCYIIFAWILKDISLGLSSWLWKERGLVSPRQLGISFWYSHSREHSSEGRVLLDCSPHSPPWLDDLQYTACTTRYGNPNHEELCMGWEFTGYMGWVFDYYKSWK